MSVSEDPLRENRPGARKEGLVPEAPEGSVPPHFPIAQPRRGGGSTRVRTRERESRWEKQGERKKEKTGRKG